MNLLSCHQHGKSSWRRTEFGDSRFPDDDDTDGPRNLDLLAIDNLTRLLAREYFIGFSRRETLNYTTIAPLKSIPSIYTYKYPSNTLLPY